MIKAVQPQRNLIAIVIPLFLVLALIFFTQSTLFKSRPSQFSLAVTIDFLLTLPVVYFLFIRKTKIPKTTVVPVFILGIILASIFLPADQQQLLQQIKRWVVPVIEFIVLSFIGYKAYKMMRIIKKGRQASQDFYTQTKKLCTTNFGAAIGPFLASEISVFYYGFLVWKNRRLNEDSYTYHKKSGSVTLLIALIGIILIETVVLHAVLVKYNLVIAWIVTGLSLYTLLQIFGVLKSIPQRPIIVDDKILYLRYGILTETQISIENIKSIELTSKDFKSNKNIRYLSPLGALEGHSMILHLHQEQTLEFMYGVQKKYTSIALHVDALSAFEHKLQQLKIKHHG